MLQIAAPVELSVPTPHASQAEYDGIAYDPLGHRVQLMPLWLLTATGAEPPKQGRPTRDAFRTAVEATIEPQHMTPPVVRIPQQWSPLESPSQEIALSSAPPAGPLVTP
jgi:hypothetical protein